jgi:hypothetical protein
MTEVIEIPASLTYFQLPETVQTRLQFLLDPRELMRKLRINKKPS